MDLDQIVELVIKISIPHARARLFTGTIRISWIAILQVTLAKVVAARSTLSFAISVAD